MSQVSHAQKIKYCLCVSRTQAHGGPTRANTGEGEGITGGRWGPVGQGYRYVRAWQGMGGKSEEGFGTHRRPTRRHKVLGIGMVGGIG